MAQRWIPFFLKILCDRFWSIFLLSILGDEGQSVEETWKKVVPDGHFDLDESNGYADSILIINDAKMEDRAEYMCYAWNELGSSNSTVLIRVIGNILVSMSIIGTSLTPKSII